MYCDLNLQTPKSKNNSELYELITSAICDDYSILAITTNRKGIIPNDPINKTPEVYKDKNTLKSLYEKNSIKFLNCENIHLINWKNKKILTRLTIEISDQKEMYQFSKPNAYMNSFDILAIEPKNDKILENCLNGEPLCDIIVLNLDEKFSFYHKKHLLIQAVDNNVFFEVNYAKFVTNNESRGTFISNFLCLLDILKGRNIILTSGAENYFMHRGPFDICTIFETIFHIKHNVIKPMISTNQEKVVMKSIQRKFYKTAVLVSIENGSKVTD